MQGLIFDYYDKLCASVTTKDWATAFFPFDIGLFQGCVLSTILFDCVFNLFLAPLEAEHAVTVEGEITSSRPTLTTWSSPRHLKATSWYSTRPTCG